MQTFRYWQPVRFYSTDAAWADGRYLSTYDDKTSALAHTVMDADGCEVDVEDRLIRPTQWLEVVGGDLEIVEAALGQHYHHHVELDLKLHGKVTDRTLRVRQLHEAAKAAMEAGK